MLCMYDDGRWPISAMPEIHTKASTIPHNRTKRREVQNSLLGSSFADDLCRNSLLLLVPSIHCCLATTLVPVSSELCCVLP